MPLREDCETYPSYRSDFLVDICLALGTSVACNSIEILGEWDRRLVYLLIVCLERGWVYLRVVITVHVVESWGPLIFRSVPGVE